MHDCKHTVVRGFTLIELLLVISILSILLALTTSFYSRFLVQSAVSDTQDQLVGILRKAQIYSMMGKGDSAWGVHYTQSPQKQLVLFKGTAFGQNPALDETVDINNVIVITGLGTDIYFQRLSGKPNIAVAMTIDGNNTQKSVSITAQGAVSR